MFDFLRKILPSQIAWDVNKMKINVKKDVS